MFIVARLRSLAGDWRPHHRPGDPIRAGSPTREGKRALVIGSTRSAATVALFCVLGARGLSMARKPCDLREDLLMGVPGRVAPLAV